MSAIRSSLDCHAKVTDPNDPRIQLRRAVLERLDRG
jgi:hypothetical protein